MGHKADQEKRKLKFEQETIRRAEQGDSEAGRLALDMVAGRLDRRELDSPLFDYCASSIRAYLDEGISLDRAFGVQEKIQRGERPRKHAELEIAAVDLLLRDHANFKTEKALEWIDEQFLIDRRTVQRIRIKYDSRYSGLEDAQEDGLMETMDMDLLLHNAGSMRKNLEGVLPQT